jgi:hypothetical protein
MPDPKTRPETTPISAVIDALPDLARRKDSEILINLMRDITGHEPLVWGSRMIGFGQYHYRYASGHEGDSFLTGFTPRANDFSLYFHGGFEQYAALLARLGKHKLGKGCLYLKRLSDVDLTVLREMIEISVAWVRAEYGETP